MLLTVCSGHLQIFLISTKLQFLYLLHSFLKEKNSTLTRDSATVFGDKLYKLELFNILCCEPENSLDSNVYT